MQFHQNDLRREKLISQMIYWYHFSYDVIFIHPIKSIEVTMEAVLEQERKKSPLSPDHLGCFLYGRQFYWDLKQYLGQGPTLDFTPNLYNKSQFSLFLDSYRYLPLIYNCNMNKPREGLHFDHLNNYCFLASPHQMPGSVHFGMFAKYIDLMGTQQHKRLYFEKALNCEIRGCYAQIEVGHGSDIRSLETTSTYDPATKEWIVDSPTASSAKYWPGDMSFFANYAIVFAQTIIKGKSYGVNPFLVPIRGQDFRELPGVEVGDIGPKLGFHGKENGYLYLRNIRIPKVNLFTKYAEVTDEGQFKKVGDPRVGFGALMFIRETIVNSYPRVFGAAIIAASRYSFFRSQGVDEQKKEINVLEYQTQQEKVIPRIAEYYVLTVGGAKIREVSMKNSQNVQKNDFSLLEETHSNLCFGKCLYSEVCQDGIEVLRRSMGGHGTSYYSGVPQAMNQVTANNTLEGQNTVMYLQTARYVLKSYLGHITKGKPLTESVSYISRFSELAEVQFSGKKPWTLHELRDLLVKTLHYLIEMVGGRVASKQDGETERDVINFKVGIRLQQLAQFHAVHFVFNQFVSALQAEKNQQLRPLLFQLGKLFAIVQIQRLAEPIIETGLVCPVKWSLLDSQKQAALKGIRPHVAVLVDSLGIPDKLCRSEVASGNPYQNFLNRARQCQINTTVTKSAVEVGHIHKILAAKPRL